MKKEFWPELIFLSIITSVVGYIKDWSSWEGCVLLMLFMIMSGVWSKDDEQIS